MKSLGRILLLSAATLALTTASASATSSRADYAAQVNAICKATNTQGDLLYAEFSRLLRKVADADEDRVSKRAVLRFKRLYNQIEVLYAVELAQLEQVAPAPGDEAVVSRWIGNRHLLINLAELEESLARKSLRILEKGLSGRRIPSAKAFRRMQRRSARLHRQEVQVETQLEAASDLDLEIGTALGATYCVTGASGSSSASGFTLD